MRTSIQISFDIENKDDIRKVLEQLSEIGATNMVVDQVTYETPPDTKNKLILAITYAEDEPYFVVDSEGDWPDEGQTLSGKQLNDLVTTGVCVRIQTRYPNADKYGVPEYAYSERKAAQFIAEQGFKVSTSLEVSAEDSGDDSLEMYWLTFKV